MLYDFTPMWNLRNKTNEQKGKKGKERRKPSKGLLTIKNKLMVIRGEVNGEIG